MLLYTYNSKKLLDLHDAFYFGIINSEFPSLMVQINGNPSQELVNNTCRMALPNMVFQLEISNIPLPIKDNKLLKSRFFLAPTVLCFLSRPRCVF